MDQKRRLIDSMQKLIKYVSLSQKNQQQIFQSLSKKDIGKILGNLQDNSLELRTVSFCLLSKLLYKDQTIKSSFCEMIGIPIIPGKIILNQKILGMVAQKNLPNLIKLIKKPISSSMNELNSYSTWYINIKQQPYRIDYTDYSIGDIDPRQYAIGIILKKKIQPSHINLNQLNLDKKRISETDRKYSNNPIMDNKSITQRHDHKSKAGYLFQVNLPYQLNKSDEDLKVNHQKITPNINGRIKLLNSSMNYNDKSIQYSNNIPIYGFDEKKYAYNNKFKVIGKPQSAQIGYNHFYSPLSVQSNREIPINASYTINSPIDKKKNQFFNINRTITQGQHQKRYNQTNSHQFYHK